MRPGPKENEAPPERRLVLDTGTDQDGLGDPRSMLGAELGVTTGAAEVPLEAAGLLHPPTASAAARMSRANRDFMSVLLWGFAQTLRDRASGGRCLQRPKGLQGGKNVLAAAAHARARARGRRAERRRNTFTGAADERRPFGRARFPGGLESIDGSLALGWRAGRPCTAAHRPARPRRLPRHPVA